MEEEEAIQEENWSVVEKDEEFWEESDSTTKPFSQNELDMVYGKNRAPVIGESPGLLRATVLSKSFGKDETLASRRARNIFARLKSIELDSQFVSRVRNEFDELPMFANLRNGLWYLKEEADGECRFRSGDGHFRAWSFYPSRANIPLAITAFESGGALIVDSTRFGKRFPDSFSRSVPLWCAIINRAVGFKDATIELPPWLHPSETRLITESNLIEWAEIVSSLMKKEELPQIRLRPLKPYWIGNDMLAWRRENSIMEDFSNTIDCKNYTPIICVSASAIVSGEQHREFHSWDYFPGGADDEENWAKGLTAKLFWENSQTLLESSESCLALLKTLGPDMVSDLVSIQATPTLVGLFGIAPPITEIHYDLSWLQGADKAWNRRNPDAWQHQAIPNGLIKFRDFRNKNPDGQFSVFAKDDETSLTMVLAIMAVFFDEQLQPVQAYNKRVDKEALRRCEAQLNAKTPGLAISRRLIKELTIFFSKAVWINIFSKDVESH